jgi:hypothetical protein
MEEPTQGELMDRKLSGPLKDQTIQPFVNIELANTGKRNPHDS